jgi:hypothetical protein
VFDLTRVAPEVGTDGSELLFGYTVAATFNSALKASFLFVLHMDTPKPSRKASPH